MAINAYFVYLLKDPTSPTAPPFYVGYGTGARAEAHAVTPDKTRKGKKIQSLRQAGLEPVVDRVVDNLSEPDAIRIEAALIRSFGTVDTGGTLLNKVVPSGRSAKPSTAFTVPHGAVDSAHLGIRFLKDAIVDLVRANRRSGIGNADIAKSLGIQMSFRARQQNQFTHQLLGELEKQNVLRQDPTSSLWYPK